MPTPIANISITVAGLAVLTLLEFGGDWFFTKDLKWFGVGVLCYTLIGVAWGLLVIHRKELQINLAVLNAAWQILSVVAIAVLSSVVLGEPINLWVGIGLGVCCAGILIAGVGESMNQDSPTLQTTTS